MQAERTPTAVALTCAGATLTYSELNARANRLARRLRAEGVGPEVLVGLCAGRSTAMVVGLLAVLKAGGAYVPLDPAYPAERLAFMLGDARATVILTQADLLDGLPTVPRRSSASIVTGTRSKGNPTATCLAARGFRISPMSSIPRARPAGRKVP